MNSQQDGTFAIWLYTFISVILVSILGMVPIVCMPRLQRSRYKDDLLQFLIGLAIGTLAADALLHLLPIVNHGAHSHGLRDDSSDQRHAHHSDEGFWLGFMALVGIVGFLVIERVMVLLTDIFTHGDHSAGHPVVAVSSGHLALPMTGQHHQDHHNHPHKPQLHSHDNHHQHQHHHLTNETKSFMFMIITGDGLHNFFDGIAIGVSYGSSVAVGLSTTIAILCHELPHEIGDFAVLIKAGMSIRRALLYNALSSILCLLGATTGVFIGKIDVGWVSALIAGMFLYISLVDMVPLLDCYPGQRAMKRVKKLFVQLTGIVAGIVIMSLISNYESKFHHLINYLNWTGGQV